jgi:hypothetical protein
LPVQSTFSPPASPPMNMLSMLNSLLPPGDSRCMSTKSRDSVTAAGEQEQKGGQKGGRKEGVGRGV